MPKSCCCCLQPTKKENTFRLKKENHTQVHFPLRGNAINHAIFPDLFANNTYVLPFLSSPLFISLYMMFPSPSSFFPTYHHIIPGTGNNSDPPRRYRDLRETLVCIAGRHLTYYLRTGGEIASDGGGRQGRDTFLHSDPTSSCQSKNDEERRRGERGGGKKN